MKKAFLVLSSWFIVLGIAGCVVRTYPLTKDRIDQDLAMGNRGYLKGQMPEGQEVRERKSARTIQAIEVELHSPIKFERMPKAKVAQETTVQTTEDKQVWGNRGFISESSSPEVLETETAIASAPVNLEKYTVQKNDTLQKISQKFYGTTKKWNKIYQANKDMLKGPDKIYPGQVINIPLESLKEPKENLK